jgi:hypothetical protein
MLKNNCNNVYNDIINIKYNISMSCSLAVE